MHPLYKALDKRLLTPANDAAKGTFQIATSCINIYIFPIGRMAYRMQQSKSTVNVQPAEVNQAVSVM